MSANALGILLAFLTDQLRPCPTTNSVCKLSDWRNATGEGQPAADDSTLLLKREGVATALRAGLGFWRGTCLWGTIAPKGYPQNSVAVPGTHLPGTVLALGPPWRLPAARGRGWVAHAGPRAGRVTHWRIGGAGCKARQGSPEPSALAAEKAGPALLSRRELLGQGPAAGHQEVPAETITLVPREGDTRGHLPPRQSHAGGDAAVRMCTGARASPVAHRA